MERFGKYNVVGIKDHLSSHQIRYNTKLIFCKKYQKSLRWLADTIWGKE